MSMLLISSVLTDLQKGVERYLRRDEVLDQTEMMDNDPGRPPSQRAVKANLDQIRSDLPQPGAGPKFIRSGGISIALGWRRSVPHGFGARPDIVQLWARCIVPEYDYEAEDWVQVPTSGDDGLNNNGITIEVDATNITVRYSATNPLVIIRKDNNETARMSENSWVLYAHAIYFGS